MNSSVSAAASSAAAVAGCIQRRDGPAARWSIRTPAVSRSKFAAIRGHRFHDAESELRLIGELARMNLFGAGLSASLKSVDRPEAGGDLRPIHPADGCAEGVADRHAEQCAEELILCCVWHLTHPKRGRERLRVVDAQPVES